MPSLKFLLMLDAVSCAVMGVGLVAAAPVISNLTAIPSALSVTAGLLLLPTALFMAITATRFIENPVAVWTIVLGNGAWAVASLLLIATGLLRPNAFGLTVIAVQAVVVGIIALLEAAAYQNTRRQAA